MNQELKELAVALVTLKYDVIIINLIALCIAIVGVYFVTRIKKSAELREINNNFATLKKQQTELAKATGEIKQSIDIKNINYQIKLNAYHENSIKAINEIYISLIDIREMARDIAFDLTDEKKKTIYKKLYEFIGTFDQNKIWIPSDLSNSIEAVAKEIEKRLSRFFMASKQEKHIHMLEPERIDKINDELEKFYDYINKEINIIFEDLVEKISKKISV